jgi:hypothetical protein
MKAKTLTTTLKDIKQHIYNIELQGLLIILLK